jgi:HK97 family phage prohead protease
MSIREEMKLKLKQVENQECRAFFARALNRDRTDVFGFVPYNMVSLPIPAGGQSFREFIKAGAFSESLKDEVKLLYSHGALELATTKDGSLRLNESSDGIRFRAKILDAEVRQSIMDAVDIGELVGASIGFTSERESWDRKENIRYIEKGRLIEISLVQSAAYPQASACGKVIGTGR